jgi:hypothetical protein
MKATQRLIYAGFATAALASASLPALSWTAWPDVDFEWYANVGKPVAAAVETFPAAREGYIWAPGHYEWSGARQNWIAGHWIRDDYAQQVASYATRGTTFATGPMTLRDRDGNVIATDPAAYPVDSTRR